MSQFRARPTETWPLKGLRSVFAIARTTRLLREACAALVAPMRVVLTFRGRHRLVAQAAYTEQVRLYPTGSAGYGVDTLEHVLKLSYEMSKVLRNTPTQAAPSHVQSRTA
jgi:hypothetical protein